VLGISPNALSLGGAKFICENTTPVVNTRHYRLVAGPRAGAYATTWSSEPNSMSVFSYESMRDQVAKERAQGLNVGSVDEFVRSGCRSYN
jgi:hypothetical protein